MNLLLPMAILAVMGFVFAIALGFISDKFHVEKSVKEAAVRDCLLYTSDAADDCCRV